MNTLFRDRIKMSNQQVNHATDILTHPANAVPPGLIGYLEYIAHVPVEQYLAIGSAILLTLNLGAWAWKGIRALRRCFTKTRRRDDEG
jgi:hypothetical protein